MASAYMNSLKANFSPTKKGEVNQSVNRGNKGATVTPTRKRPSGTALTIGKK